MQGHPQLLWAMAPGALQALLRAQPGRWVQVLCWCLFGRAAVCASSRVAAEIAQLLAEPGICENLPLWLHACNISLGSFSLAVVSESRLCV